MILEVNDLSHLTPSEAHQKLAYVQLRLWQEQYAENFFVKDPRPEYHLKYELQAFWNGYISEIHGWTNPIGQVAQWVVDKVKEMLSWFWENVFQPGISAIINAASSVWNAIKSKVEDLWDRVISIYNKVVDVYNYITLTLYQKLSDAWNWLKDIGSTVYNKAREALNVVWDWVQDAGRFVINAVLDAMKFHFEIQRKFFELALNAVKSVVEKLHEASQSAWHSLTEMVSGGFETITKAMSALPQTIAAAFQTAVSYVYDVLKNVWDKVLVPFGSTLKDALKWFAQKIQDMFFTISDTIHNILESVIPLTPEKAPNLSYTLLKVAGLAGSGLLGMTAVWDLMHPFKDVIPGELKAMIYDVTNFNKILGAMTGALFTISIAQPMKYYYNAKLRPYILSWGDIMELRSRGMLDDETFIRFMHYYGYDDIYKPYFDELAKTPLGFTGLYRLAIYGLYDEQLFREGLKRYGYAEEVIGKLMVMLRLVSLSDAQRLFKSDVVKRYLLGITDWQGFDDELKAVGYSEIQRNLIRSLVGLREEYEYMDEYIKALRYSYRRGAITLQELGAQLANLGLRPEKITQITTIEMVRSREDVGTTQEEEVRAYGRSTAIKRFKEGLTTPAELEQELRIMGYSDQWIQRLKIVAQLERDYDFAMTVLSAVKSAWEKGTIGDETFIQLLRQYGFTDDKISLELGLLKLKKGLLLPEGGEA